MKWKVGSLYYDTINDFVVGRTINPDRTVYVCVEIKEEVVELLKIPGLIMVQVNIDDRYGRYPPVDKKAIENINARINEAKSNVETLLNLKRLIDIAETFRNSFMGS